MSTLLRLSVPRLEKAIDRYVKNSKARPMYWSDSGPSFTVKELVGALVRRGQSERDAHALLSKITHVLEPPSCYMSHCKHFGNSGAPMNCLLERTPGRCSIHKAYLDRKAEKDAKAKGDTSNAPE